jgi:hypothetical protein
MDMEVTMKKYKPRKKTNYYRLMLDRVDMAIDGDHWIWQGVIKPDGYGIITWGKRKHQHCTTAARRMYMLHYKIESLSKKIDIAHRPEFKCPRNCVNPEHLYEATRKENQQDSIKAGTFHFAVSPSKFTPEQKKQIVSEIIPQHSNVIELAMEYGVTPRYIFDLISATRCRKKSYPNEHLTMEQVQDIRKRYRGSPGNLGEVAKKHEGASRGMIMRWRKELRDAEAHG